MSLNLRQVAQVLAGANDALIITDGEGRIQDTNAAHARLTGYTQDEVIGKNLFRIHGGLSCPDTYKSVWRGIKQNQNWLGEISNRRKTGEVYTENFSLCAISDSEGKTQNFIAVMSDLSDSLDLDSVAWKRANYDYVTGLPNRQLFLERLDQEIKKYRRNGAPMALLLLDLDRFKEVNDTLGHMKGDVLLEEAARRICRVLRETDTVSRLGGDEFAIILPECALLHVQQAAHDITEALAQPFESGRWRSLFHFGQCGNCALSRQCGRSQYPGETCRSGHVFRQGGRAEPFPLFPSCHAAGSPNQDDPDQ
ncbi:diguanylate cyclase/phosphodiesterase with PAS/PAC and GAF sensor(s) [mine drainage metagenome]|uniref:Diguanylate cyclase/phosphodiesterase with PAS/PAC and GAF sensor(S) n=1 Tax=mine drainage metagenome TaxID=410659 RepID=T1C7C1_9ZZZZ